MRSKYSFIRNFLDHLRSFLPGSGSIEELSPPAAPTSSLVAPVTPRVSLLVLDPVLPTEGGRRLTQVLGWNDPNRLTAGFIQDLHLASYGYANYTIAERILVDSFPPLADGFTYSGAEFLRCWRARRGFHKPEGVDYHRLLADYQIIDKINQGLIDEVWALGFPYAGFYESRMAGPGAFWCNAPPLENRENAYRRFIVMGFNFERGLGEMLESYGHRAESILEHVFRSLPPKENLWKRFTRYDKSHPGQAEVGNIHFAPNSTRDYEWGSRRRVPSRSHTWLNFPDLSGEHRWVDSAEWGYGDIRAHHLWWFRHLPHVAGQTHGISNNWWEYIVDPNRMGIK